MIYDSSIVIKGNLFDFVENEYGDIIILSFKQCSVVYYEDEGNKNKSILFEPSWGVFDLLIGKKIVSTYPNAADMESFPIEKIDFKSCTIHPEFSKTEKQLHVLYAAVREMRETIINPDELLSILNELMNKFQEDWLLTLEICELVKDKYIDIYHIAHNHLMSIKKAHSKYEKLILDGINIMS